MGFDRTGDGEDAASDSGRPAGAVPGPERGGDIRERDGQAAARAGREGRADDGISPDAGESAAGKLAVEDRITAHLRARAAADAAYADWEPENARADRTAAKPAHVPGADGDQQDRDAGDASRERPDADPAPSGDSPVRPPDTSSPAEEVLRRRVGELEAGKAAGDRQLAGYEARFADQGSIIADQGRTIAALGKGMARLEAELGRVAGSLDELRGKQEEPRASADIERRFRGKEAERPEWKEEQQKRRLPTDAVNAAVSAAAGAAITALPYQVHDFPPEVAGLAAGGVALGAGIIAVWRERRKAKDDDGHRPEN